MVYNHTCIELFEEGLGRKLEGFERSHKHMQSEATYAMKSSTGDQYPTQVQSSLMKIIETPPKNDNHLESMLQHMNNMAEPHQITPMTQINGNNNIITNDQSCQIIVNFYNVKCQDTQGPRSRDVTPVNALTP
jgi:hypothetical protein